MKLLWNISAGKLYPIIMWLVFTVQSVTMMRRASVKSRQFANDKHKKFEGQLPCWLYSALSDWFLLPGLSLIKCASVHCLHNCWKQSLLSSCIFFYKLFLLPLILYLVRQMLYTDDPFMWLSSHRFLRCHSFLEQWVPGRTAWLLHWENGLLGQRDQARRSSGVHSGKHAALQKFLAAAPAGVPWHGGCARSHDPACGACSVQDRNLGGL